MIGVDSNILIRIFVQDDAHQTRLAIAFLEERTASDPAFVSAVVIAELIWALEGSYGFDREAVHTALESLLDSANVKVEWEDAIAIAVSSARSNNAGIADSIIAAIATEVGAASTVTFDARAAKRIPGMELLR
jgi:predicted nucleic-acid-binding protein